MKINKRGRADESLKKDRGAPGELFAEEKMRYVLIVLALIVLLIVLALFSDITLKIKLSDKRTKAVLRVFGVIKKEFPVDEEEAAETKDEAGAEDTGAPSERKAAEEDREKDENSGPGGEKDGIITRILLRIKNDARDVFGLFPIVDFGRLIGVIEEYGRIYKGYKLTLKSFIHHLRRKIRITECDIFIKYGAGDPADTGMAYGGVCAAAPAAYSFLSGYFRIRYPKIVFEPNYYEKTLEYEIDLKFKLRAAFIISALTVSAFRALTEYVKYLRLRKENMEDTG